MYHILIASSPTCLTQYMRDYRSPHERSYVYRCPRIPLYRTKSIEYATADRKRNHHRRPATERRITYICQYKHSDTNFTTCPITMPTLQEHAPDAEPVTDEVAAISTELSAASQQTQENQQLMQQSLQLQQHQQLQQLQQLQHVVLCNNLRNLLPSDWNNEDRASRRVGNMHWRKQTIVCAKKRDRKRNAL